MDVADTHGQMCEPIYFKCQIILKQPNETLTDVITETYGCGTFTEEDVLYHAKHYMQPNDALNIIGYATKTPYRYCEHLLLFESLDSKIHGYDGIEFDLVAHSLTELNEKGVLHPEKSYYHKCNVVIKHKHETVKDVVTQIDSEHDTCELEACTTSYLNTFETLSVIGYATGTPYEMCTHLVLFESERGPVYGYDGYELFLVARILADVHNKGLLYTIDDGYHYGYASQPMVEYTKHECFVTRYCLFYCILLCITCMFYLSCQSPGDWETVENKQDVLARRTLLIEKSQMLREELRKKCERTRERIDILIKKSQAKRERIRQKCNENLQNADC